MKNLKRMIIILSVLAIIIFICILILNKNSQEWKTKLTDVDESDDFIKAMSIVNNNETFFSVEKMLEMYILRVASKDKEATYGILDDDYIKNNNITEENVLTKIPEIISENDNYRIRQMYGQTNLENEVYYIYCIFENNKSENTYFALYNDKQNVTYSVEHITEETYNNEIKNTKKTLAKKTINSNDYNSSKSIFPSEQEIVNKYFKNYLENAVYDVEYTYSILDEEYKKERFPTIEEFKGYIENKKNLYVSAITSKTYEDFSSMDEYIEYITQKQKLKLQGYQIRYIDNYTRYVCIDSYNNYYVFVVTTPLNYTLMLDTYTVDLPEFTEKYSSSTTEEKAGYNIQKIVEALNTQDYNYVYSKLADDFKANYFKTYEDFEKYAKETFAIKNEVEFNKYTTSENLSTYEITLNGQGKTVTKTIIMRLDEGTNYVFAFDV